MLNLFMALRVISIYHIRPTWITFYLTDYVDHAVRHVMMRQGVLGVTVSIMLPHDPTVSSSGERLNR